MSKKNKKETPMTVSPPAIYFDSGHVPRRDTYPRLEALYVTCAWDSCMLDAVTNLIIDRATKPKGYCGRHASAALMKAHADSFAAILIANFKEQGAKDSLL